MSYERLEPALRRVVETRPDTVVGVLIRLRRDVEDSDRDRLRAAGLVLGSARGRLVTGNLRARLAPRLAALEPVEWIELAATLFTTPRR